ncbi:MAG TPA: hypothetical protein PK511_09605 [Chitinophagales bacterium]|nr:hypothetical protein [bacterium]HMY95671.1 hypothetical protein [Cyclobacteriaceae bacterium]HNA14598.1 hypothetical protein [Cyclobacteriaceae bacterium]HNH32134.1 hypothetical protein [bacterium]HNI54764.1 hypothetical protein [Chitinophagales bacterium]
MATILNQCEDCVEIVFDECADIPFHPSGGISDGSYWWFITDNFGNTWKQSFTVSEGEATILKALLPEGFTTSAIGQIDIRIRDAEDSTTDISFEYNSIEYTCIKATFSKVTLIPD